MVLFSAESDSKIDKQLEARDKLVQVLGLPENATDKQIADFIEREHGKESAPVVDRIIKEQWPELEAEFGRRARLGWPGKSEEKTTENTRPESATKLLAAESHPHRITHLFQLKTGGTYRMHSRSDNEAVNIMILEPPRVVGDESAAQWRLTIKNLINGIVTTRNCYNLGLAAPGQKPINDSEFWLELLTSDKK